jgi:hypothetical protein
MNTHPKSPTSKSTTNRPKNPAQQQLKIIVIDKYTLAQRLRKNQKNCEENFEKNQTDQDPARLTHKEIQEIAQTLIDTFDPNENTPKVFPKSQIKPQETYDLHTIRKKICALYPKLSEPQKNEFSKTLLLTIKEKQLVEKLVQINQEVLEFEADRKRLAPLHATLPISPYLTTVQHWMKNLRVAQQETDNPTILKLVTKTEHRIEENLTTETLISLRQKGLNPQKSKPRPTLKTNLNLKNIPQQNLAMTEALKTAIQTHPAPLKIPILRAIQLLILGVSQTQINPKAIKEKSQINIKEGTKKIIQGTNSLDPLNPTYKSPRHRSSPEIEPI